MSLLQIMAVSHYYGLTHDMDADFPSRRQKSIPPQDQPQLIFPNTINAGLMLFHVGVEQQLFSMGVQD
jgi:hypothetical protein